MILHNSYNRSLILEYLETVSEDDFIEHVIIPFFAKTGYSLFRHNTHGPGEHGADLIFTRYVPVFLESEYVIIQAKAEKVTAGNVTKLADQLTRAYKISFPGKSSAKLRANYAVLINARKHTNEANSEFAELTDKNNNIKVLAQDNILDMVLRLDILIEPLKDLLEKGQLVNLSFEDRVREIIFSGNNDLINKLLDKDLKIETLPLSDELKGLIINYTFQKWSEDQSWAAIARPIMWLNSYFDYIQPFQFNQLLRVLEEYTYSYRSKAALSDTIAVVNKITIKQIKTFEAEFLRVIVKLVRDNKLNEYPAIESKYAKYLKSKIVKNQFGIATIKWTFS